MINLPEELTIWNNMTPTERFEIMQASGANKIKSITKMHRACMAYIAANLV